MKVRKALFANLANLITTLRLICSVLLVILALSADLNSYLSLMFILVVVCIVSDFFDGLVARYLRIESQAGKILDRLADKIFIVAVFPILIFNYWSPDGIHPIILILTEGLVMVVIFLEFFLMINGLLSLMKGLDVGANKWGRAKMACQCLAIVFWVGFALLEKLSIIKVVRFHIILIDIILVAAIFLAVKSIEGYLKRWNNIKNT